MRILMFLLLCVAPWAGCTGEDLLGPTFQACSPGEERSCPCHGREDGRQSCASHGRHWLRCACGEAEGEGEPPQEGEGEPPQEGEGEPPQEGEGEGAVQPLVLADLAGVWQIRALDVSLVEEEIAVVKGSFTLDDGGDITAGRFWARSPVGDGTYLELGEVLEGEFRVVEAKARTATCFFRVAIGTVTGDGTVSQSGRSITGHYETNFETSGTFDALRYPAGNDSWVCHHGFSGVGDGCDCGCGEVDSDCRTGCDEPGCAGGDCLFCYDGDGVASVCPD